MRELRFRFWDAKEGKWLGKDSSYWKELTFEDCRNKLIASMRQGNIVAEQYTGLKDKNGKEVYEGDLVANGTLIGVVEYKVDDFCAWTVRGTTNGVVLLSGSWTVIGNVHESNMEWLGIKPTRTQSCWGS